MGLKKCSACKLEKDVVEFSKAIRNKDGLRYECKTCHRAKENARRLLDVSAYNEAQKNRRASNYDAVRAREKLYRENNPEIYKMSAAKHYVKNKDAILKAQKQYYLAHKEIIYANSSRWKKANPSVIAESSRRRYAAKVGATPKWADMNEIREWYRTAEIMRQQGADVQVDHIVPLRSPIVCGLHVEHNLQILTSKMNRTKNNRFWPNMPDESLRRF